MATLVKDAMADVLIQKLTTGIHLTEDEKSHLVDCKDCWDHLFEALYALPRKPIDRSQARPELLAAIEHGRRVFEREFGIKIPTE